MQRTSQRESSEFTRQSRSSGLGRRVLGFRVEKVPARLWLPWPHSTEIDRGCDRTHMPPEAHSRILTALTAYIYFTSGNQVSSIPPMRARCACRPCESWAAGPPAAARSTPPAAPARPGPRQSRLCLAVPARPPPLAGWTPPLRLNCRLSAPARCHCGPAHRPNGLRLRGVPEESRTPAAMNRYLKVAMSLDRPPAITTLTKIGHCCVCSAGQTHASKHTENAHYAYCRNEKPTCQPARCAGRLPLALTAGASSPSCRPAAGGPPGGDGVPSGHEGLSARLLGPPRPPVAARASRSSPHTAQLMRNTLTAEVPRYLRPCLQPQRRASCLGSTNHLAHPRVAHTRLSLQNQRRHSSCR